mmetsp:Transcript_16751/g.32602  ORF Transcript_16751/g.32602 Transcript_16751/m.32602 type:complete len:277 (+) Transcript_16751:291-1121(+)|eukprot:CAMPEP_0171495952 /NCGR_PEP_ID=MMETSP0958-20121227/6426_1 /TAXON_ID=87120 /ORGANISM="Aurantiochytrium limacinum, Strain ATCCMYA-1381" /LENGTH=276 /DNA_ID=CAMNT_0012029989 /DNA_START=174 /DNA_END=1004 /DNA_ORIENTATION=-
MATTAFGASLAMIVGSAYTTPALVHYLVGESQVETMKSMTPWVRVQGRPPVNLLGDEGTWCVLLGASLLAMSFTYLITWHAKMPVAQARATGLARLVIAAGLVFMHLHLGFPKLVALIAGNDILTGLLTILMPTYSFTILPNMVMTWALGLGLMTPELRPKVAEGFAMLAVKMDEEPVQLNVEFLFHVFLATLCGHAVMPLVGAMLMNARCLRASGKVGLMVAGVFAVAAGLEHIDQELAIFFGAAHAIYGFLVLVIVPKEVDVKKPTPGRKQKTI